MPLEASKQGSQGSRAKARSGWQALTRGELLAGPLLPHFLDPGLSFLKSHHSIPPAWTTSTQSPIFLFEEGSGKSGCLAAPGVLDETDFLDPFPSGFRPSYRTETALVALMDDLWWEWDQAVTLT